MRLTTLLLLCFFLGFSSVFSTSAQDGCQIDLVPAITALVEAQRDADTGDTGGSVRGIAAVQEQLTELLNNCEGVIGQVYLPEQYVAADGAFSFSYPENWHFELLQPGIVLTGTSPDIAEIVSASSPPPVEVGTMGVIVIYTDLSDMNIDSGSLEEVTENLRSGFADDARPSPAQNLSISDHRAQSFRIETADYLIYGMVVDYSTQFGVFLGVGNPTESDEVIMTTNAVAETLRAPAQTEEVMEATFSWDDYSVGDVIAIQDIIEDGDPATAVLSHNGESFAWYAENAICLYRFEDESQRCTPISERFRTTERLEWSLDDRYIAFTENWTRLLDEPDIWVFDIENRRISNLVDDGQDKIIGAEGPVLIDTTPTWHPDGSLYFVRHDRESGVTSLYKINPDETNPELVSEFNDFETLNSIYTSGYTQLNGAMEFSPDGKTLAILIRGIRPAEPTNGIYLVDMTASTLELEMLIAQSELNVGSLPEYVERSGSMYPNSIAWSADGTKLYTFLEYPQFMTGQTLIQIDVETGNVITLPDLSNTTEEALLAAEDGELPQAFDLPRAAAMVPGSNIPVGLNFYQGTYGLTLYDTVGLVRIYQAEIDPMRPTNNSSASADGKLIMMGYLFLPAND